jgi:hypothetical protein
VTGWLYVTIAFVGRSLPVRVGSLCSGYGGLELGAAAVFGRVDHVWHGENDPAAFGSPGGALAGGAERR